MNKTWQARDFLNELVRVGITITDEDLRQLMLSSESLRQIAFQLLLARKPRRDVLLWVIKNVKPLRQEPVAGISPEYREHVAERLMGLKKSGKTILLIEHQTDFLERIGDIFLLLSTGRLLRIDTVAELRNARIARDSCN